MISRFQGRSPRLVKGKGRNIEYLRRRLDIHDLVIFLSDHVACIKLTPSRERFRKCLGWHHGGGEGNGAHNTESAVTKGGHGKSFLLKLPAQNRDDGNIRSADFSLSRDSSDFPSLLTSVSVFFYVRILSEWSLDRLDADPAFSDSLPHLQNRRSRSLIFLQAGLPRLCSGRQPKGDAHGELLVRV